MNSTTWLNWHIVPHISGLGLPKQIISQAARFGDKNMAEEVAMLLPANDGPSSLIDHVIENPLQFTDTIIGLFLANPFFNVRAEAARLARSKVRWVANLPSVEQQDVEFTSQLEDVSLDREREFQALARFHEEGFSVAAVVVDQSGALAAMAIDPEIVFILPRLGDYAAGFPSLRQRERVVREVKRTLGDSGWSGRLLGLGERSDADKRRLWPQRLDGLVVRPDRVIAPTTSSKEYGC